MVQFASADDLAAYLGHEIEDDQSDRADLLLRLASAAVQDAARQTFTLVEDHEITLEGVGSDGRLRLPERPVKDVASVKVDGFNVTGFKWYSNGQVTWPGGSIYDWTRVVINAPERDHIGEPVIRVVYTHGYDPEDDDPYPDDVVMTTLAVAARSFTSSDEAGEPREGPLQVGLTQAEEKALRKYWPRLNQ